MTIKYKTYECEISETFISIEYDTKLKLFWIQKYYIDPCAQSTNLLGLLLSSIISSMKQKNIKNLTMTISLDEWNDIKINENWKIVKNMEDNNLVEICCPIDNVFDCLLDGFFSI